VAGVQSSKFKVRSKDKENHAVKVAKNLQRENDFTDSVNKTKSSFDKTS